MPSWRINFFNYSRVSHAWILVSRFPFSSPAFSVVPQRPMSDGYHSVRGTGRISWQTVAQGTNSRQENHVLHQLSPPIADASQCCNKQLGLFEYFTVSRRFLSDPKIPWMTSKRDSTCFVLALASDASASTRLPCLAYISVPLSTYCKSR